jgi:hypothetical protein
MSVYEIKDTATKNPNRPYDVWKDGRCVAPGFDSKRGAEMEIDVLKGLERLKEVMDAKKEAQAAEHRAQLLRRK